jgi:hypothetical protein
MKNSIRKPLLYGACPNNPTGGGHNMIHRFKNVHSHIVLGKVCSYCEPAIRPPEASGQSYIESLNKR